MSFLLSILVAATGSIGSAPPVDPVAWVEALKVPADPVPYFGPAPGACDPEREARILEPFESLTTEQARIVVPLLIDLLEDRTPIFTAERADPHLRRNRAWDALFRVSFRRIGIFAVQIGCCGRSPALRAIEQQRDAETVAGWWIWWSENRGREIGDWRQRAVDETLAAFRGRSGDEAVTALEDLALLGRRCLPHMDRGAIPEIVKVADDPNADANLRERCIRALIAFEAEGAIESAECLAKEDHHAIDVRPAVLRDLEGAGDRGIPGLISLARHFAASADWPQCVVDSYRFTDAVRGVQRAAGRQEPWMTRTPDSVEGRMQVVQAMEQWWAESRPHPRPGQ